MSQHMENQVKELKEECLESFEKQSWSYDQVLKHFDDKSQHIVLWAKKKDREDLKTCLTQLMENQIKKLKEQCLESFENQSWSYDQALEHWDKMSIHLVCPTREQLLQDLKNRMSQHMENQVKES